MMLEYSISKRLTEGYLNQPYSWFLNRHSADLSKTILSEVSEVVGKTIIPIINIPLNKDFKLEFKYLYLMGFSIN